jgi:uncharacterized damage-inducible protein DinB
MRLSATLASRFREVIFDGTWVAFTNYKDRLQDLTWQQATAKVNYSNNTIAMLTFHINYYVEGVLHFFQKGELTISDKFSFQAPEIRSQEEWDDLRNAFFENSEALVKEFEKLSDEDLFQPFVKEAYGTYLRNIQGMIEHCYYHLGQVSLIKQTILESSS